MGFGQLVAEGAVVGEQAGVPRLYYIVPLIVAIGFVYGATRHERLGDMLGHALRSIAWMGVFLGAIMALFWWGGFWN